MMVVLAKYNLNSDGAVAAVHIVKEPGTFYTQYVLELPQYPPGTTAFIDYMRDKLVEDVTIKLGKINDPKVIERLKASFRARAEQIIAENMPSLPDNVKTDIIVTLLHDMLGLGKLEFLLYDENLEEIAINSSRDFVWVYHTRFGWLKTNIKIPSEVEIQNYASIIARRVGRQISLLHPLMDAHLLSGDRANATLFPISAQGNTITIRKFRRKPWTLVDFINTGTMTSEIAALLWMSMQYELNILISGGTASGKTTLLNLLLPFVQPNQRIITIEETRELQLPSFLHWVPLVTREPNVEGKGEVTMLDLMTNSLRMRPDRIVLGEMRTKEEAEVLFEAMHTGHSTYATLHADTAAQTVRRLINPPLDVPANMLEAVHLNVVMYRNRRTGRRYVYELAEFIPKSSEEFRTSITPNALYRWRAATGQIVQNAKPVRLYDELMMQTGLGQTELIEELKQRERIVQWIVSNKVPDTESLGRVVAHYYTEPEYVVDLVDKGKDAKILWQKK